MFPAMVRPFPAVVDAINYVVTVNGTNLGGDPGLGCSGLIPVYCRLNAAAGLYTVGPR